jgi:1-acyl-sn-glycerol-3-phosphate acyltransferase
VNLNYRIIWLLSRLAFATYFRWRVYHPERVPAEGPVILASNHSSFLDPLLVGAGVRRPLNYLARASLFRLPLAGAILRSVNALPVERDAGTGAGLRAILARLRAGGGIVLFPEGTRSPDGRLQPPRAGIGLVVIKSTAPVVPVRVFGTFDAFGRHRKIPRPFPVAVKYGLPLDFGPFRAKAAGADRGHVKEIYQEVAKAIVKAIADLEMGED